MNNEKTDFQRAKEIAEAKGLRVGNPQRGRQELYVYVNMKAQGMGAFIREHLTTTKLAVSAETLARDFATVLKGWLTPEQQAEVVARNKAQENPSICHSHDFCDANMAMDEAMRKHGIELDIQSDEQNSLWNEAWNVAKANGFWF